MMTQPAPPTPPGSPILSAQERADVAQQGVRDAQQGVRDAAQAGRDAAQAARDAAHAGNHVGVVTDAGGRVVVTGPDGKTITIDPKAGLDGDQIQQMVQTALQPTMPPRGGPNIPGELIPLAAIIFPCLMVMVIILARMFAARRGTAGPVTAVLPAEAAARLARIEQAVEAVAIEVERISEAQRYSAQLLTSRLGITPAPAVARTLDAPAARE